MNANSKIVLAGILSLASIAQGQELIGDVPVGVNVINEERLLELAGKNKFPNMTQLLLDSSIIEPTKINGTYYLNVRRLEEEKSLLMDEKDFASAEILNDILKLKVKVSLKLWRDMYSSTQDFSPAVNSLEKNLTRFKGP